MVWAIFRQNSQCHFSTVSDQFDSRVETTIYRVSDKFRIPSARLQSWDYGWNAAYFVTICPKNKTHYFGKIVDNQMVLNEIGLLAEKYWREIATHFNFARSEHHVVMPNHVHGIIVIDKSGDCYEGNHGRDAANGRDAINRVSTGGITGNKNPMRHDNLSRIMRWYKGRITFEAHKICPKFTWQSRFHDHIIRNEQSLNQITDYVHTNPQIWQKDTFYTP